MKKINTIYQKPPLRVIRARDIVPTVLMVLASRSQALGMHPFSVAFFGAVYDKNIAYLGIVSACLGIVSRAGVMAVPKYLISLLAYWLFDRLSRRDSVPLRSLASAGAVALGGAMELFIDYNGLFDIFLLLTESVMTAVMYIIFSRAGTVGEDFSKRRGMTADDYVSVAITAGVIISGFCGIGYKGISLSHILVSYVLLVTAMNTTVAVSACTGICIGFMSSMSEGNAVVMMGMYGFAALFGGFMNTYKRAGVLAGYISAVAVTFIYAQNMYGIGESAVNALIGGVLFLLTPKVVAEYFRSFFTKSVQVEAVSPVRRMKEYLSMRLRGASDAFGSLHQCFFAMSEGRLKKYSDDLGTLLDETADRVCQSCKMCGKCWQTDFRRTYKNILELIGIIEHEGVLTEENMPEQFALRCERPEEFINTLNHVYELYKRDMLRRSDAVTTRNLISMQYSEISRLFDSLADEVSDGFSFMENEEEEIVEGLDKVGIIPYEISAVESNSGMCEVYLRLPPSSSKDVVSGVISDVLKRRVEYKSTENGLSKFTTGALYSVETSALQLARDGYGVNGDTIAMFTVDDSKFYCIIADGMGSGGEAQYESSSACRLLTGFLKSGFGIKTALSILNSSLCLNMENDIYSTIDLLCIDLYTGEATMYKIGSAQTLVINGGEVRTVSSASVPVGILSDIRLDKKSLMLKEGDLILMMSDGITESGCSVSRTRWLKNLLLRPYDEVSDLAKAVMDTAVEKNNGIARDDMSVVALRFMSN